MNRRIAIFSILSLMLSLVSGLPASPIKVSLISEKEGIEPGKPFYVGLYLNPKKNYHTYYKHPGIVGVATHMRWELPEGWTADPIEWPEPKMVMMFTVRAQGYHGDWVLPIKIHPPKNLPTGGEVTLKGEATWMCCYRDCNPGSEELSLTLSVDPEKAVKTGKWTKLFHQARVRMPVELKDYRPSAKKDGKYVVLTLKPVSDQSLGFKEAVFISENELIDPSQPQELQWLDDGTLVMKLPISEYASKPIPTRLEGLLQIDRPWQVGSETRSARFSTPVK